jgi:hypothetical protein
MTNSKLSSSTTVVLSCPPKRILRRSAGRQHIVLFATSPPIVDLPPLGRPPAQQTQLPATDNHIQAVEKHKSEEDECLNTAFLLDLFRTALKSQSHDHLKVSSNF